METDLKIALDIAKRALREVEKEAVYLRERINEGGSEVGDATAANDIARSARDSFKNLIECQAWLEREQV